MLTVNGEHNCAEVREMSGDYHYEDFLIEYQNNNFDEDGNRKEAYRIFRGNLKQQYNLGLITKLYDSALTK